MCNEIQYSNLWNKNVTTVIHNLGVHAHHYFSFADTKFMVREPRDNEHSVSVDAQETVSTILLLILWFEAMGHEVGLLKNVIWNKSKIYYVLFH